MMIMARASALAQEPELEILEPVDGAKVHLVEGDNAIMRFGVNFLSGRCMCPSPPSFTSFGVMYSKGRTQRF